MIGPPVPPNPKRRWYGLALRHVRMARLLLNGGFADGAVFHLYHGYECALSALIAARGYPVPPEGWTQLRSPSGKTVKAYPSPGGGIQERPAHRARILFFDELADHTRPYYANHSRLRRYLTLDERMGSLYYDAARDRTPHERYDSTFAVNVMAEVMEFARQVWDEIR